MNDALPVRWSALTNALTTVLWMPTPIPLVEGPEAAEVVEPETKRPAPAAVRTNRPVSAAVLTSLTYPTVPPFSPGHWHLAMARLPSLLEGASAEA